jgi:hypothetical protein
MRHALHAGARRLLALVSDCLAAWPGSCALQRGSARLPAATDDALLRWCVCLVAVQRSAVCQSRLADPSSPPRLLSRPRALCSTSALAFPSPCSHGGQRRMQRRGGGRRRHVCSCGCWQGWLREWRRRQQQRQWRQRRQSPSAGHRHRSGEWRGGNSLRATRRACWASGAGSHAHLPVLLLLCCLRL